MRKLMRLTRGFLCVVIVLSLMSMGNVMAAEETQTTSEEAQTTMEDSQVSPEEIQTTPQETAPVNPGVAGPSVYKGVDYSPVYNCQFYSSKYPDLYAIFGGNGEKYIEHFVLSGMKEGRQASAGFDVKSYKNGYGDLRALYGNDLKQYYMHYIKYGFKEGRNLTVGVTELKNPVFTYKGMNLFSVYDFNYYTDRYSDIKNQYGNDEFKVIEHFVKLGCREARVAKANMNSANYERLQNISANLGAATTNYLGKDLSSIYDYAFYAWRNKDVTKAVGYDPEMVIRHFVKYGMKENRPGKLTYDQATYNAIKNAIHNTNPATKPFVDKANGYSTPTDRIILVNKGTKQVCVLKGSQGFYTVEKLFSCATGASSSPTPSGVYHVGAKGRYFNTGTNGRCWYYTQIKGNYLFHSQIYDRQSKPVNLIDGRMGVAVSHGCIRMYLNDAKWIYDNIPRGSTIVIY